MHQISMVLAGGDVDKGGIDRITDYMHQALLQLDPDLPVDIHHTRTGAGRLRLHLSVIPSLFQLGRRLSKRSGNIVHLNVAPRGSTFRKLTFLALSKAFGARVVVQLHGSGFNEFYGRQSGPVKLIIRRFFDAADLVVVLGEFWRSFVTSEMRVDPCKVIEVSNGVPDPGFAAYPGGKLPRIVFAGALGERKGVDILLKSLRGLKEEGVDFRCDILGDGDVDKYREMSDSLGVGHLVEFHGWRSTDEVRVLMANASIFVLPSRAENQPVAILEAMAMGLPVVASRIGAIPEQVADGETGFLVQPADVDSLRGALSKLIGSADLRVDFGMRGRLRWHEKFSIEANAKLLLNAYRLLSRDVATGALPR